MFLVLLHYVTVEQRLEIVLNNYFGEKDQNNLVFLFGRGGEGGGEAVLVFFELFKLLYNPFNWKTLF